MHSQTAQWVCQKIKIEDPSREMHVEDDPCLAVNDVSGEGTKSHRAAGAVLTRSSSSTVSSHSPTHPFPNSNNRTTATTL